MIDLLISCLNLLIISLRKLVSIFIFNPPKPKGYIIENDVNNPYRNIIKFLREFKNDKDKTITRKYFEIHFKNLDYEYYLIKNICNNNDINTNNNNNNNNNNNKTIPILIVRPKNHKGIIIIYSHGNSADLGTSFYETLELALYTNCIVITYEYPNYGNCITMKETEKNTYQNLLSVYYHIKNSLNFKPNQIFLYGFSLGTGVSLDLLTRKNVLVAGCVLQAPYLSIVRVWFNIKKTLFFDYFNSIDKIDKINCPIFIIHGSNDNVIPYIHGRILGKLIEKKGFLFNFLTVNNAEHNDLFVNKKMKKDEIYNKVSDFIQICYEKYYEFNNKKDLNIKIFDKNIKSNDNFNNKKIEENNRNQSDNNLLLDSNINRISRIRSLRESEIKLEMNNNNNNTNNNNSNNNTNNNDNNNNNNNNNSNYNNINNDNNNNTNNNNSNYNTINNNSNYNTINNDNNTNNNDNNNDNK